jgi:exodeoxyribonuclease-3
MGDFNIAPTDIDVHDPIAWEGKILCSKTERNKFSEFLNLGLVDSFRHTCPHSSEYSWWDYRQGSFRRNAGLRIDHILGSEKFIKTCTGAGIYKDIRKHQKPSDHAPVWAKLNFNNL